MDPNQQRQPNLPYQNHPLDPSVVRPRNLTTQVNNTDPTAKDFMFITGQPQPPERQHHRRRFTYTVTGLLLLVFAAGIFVATLPKSKSIETTASTVKPNTAAEPSVALQTQRIDGVQFAYPTTWKKIDASTLGYALAYGTGSDYTESSASIYYTKNTITKPAQTIAGTTKQTKENLSTTILSAVTNKNNKAGSGCTGFSVLKHTDIDTPKYYGIDITFSCKTNKNGVATKENDRFIYTGDGNLYQVSLTATDSEWQASQVLYSSLLLKAIPLT